MRCTWADRRGIASIECGRPSEIPFNKQEVRNIDGFVRMTSAASSVTPGKRADAACLGTTEVGPWACWASVLNGGTR